MLYRFISGLFLSLICLCTTATASTEFIKSKQGAKSEFHFNNLKAKHSQLKHAPRSKDYPTQLFNLQIKINDSEVSMEEVIGRFDELFFHYLDEGYFYTSASGFCISFETHVMECNINGFFEPGDDEAAKIADKVLAEVTGIDFFGTPFKFDESKAVVLNLTTNIGLGSENPHSLFTRYTSFNRMVKFNNVYDADQRLFNIIDENFEPTNAQKILPLIERELGGSEELAKEALMSGNTMELFIHSLFLYKDSFEMYPLPQGTSSMIYREVCGKNENDTCLSPSK